MLNTLLTWVCQHWFSLLSAAFLIGMMLYGHRQGFLRLSVTLAATIITLVLVRLLLPGVTGFLAERTPLLSVAEHKIQKSLGLEDGIWQGDTGTDTGADIGAAGPELAESAESAESAEFQDRFLEELGLSEETSKLLKKYNTKEIWELLGVSRFAQYVAGFLGRTVLNLVVFIVLFILIRILLHLLIKVLDVVARIPVIHGLNQIAGAVLGFVFGLALLWILFMMLYVFREAAPAAALLAMVRSSVWLSFLYRFNFISFLLKSLVAGIL